LVNNNHEAYFEQKGLTVVETTIGDIRYGLRMPPQKIGCVVSISHYQFYCR